MVCVSVYLSIQYIYVCVCDIYRYVYICLFIYVFIYIYIYICVCVKLVQKHKGRFPCNNTNSCVCEVLLAYGSIQHKHQGAKKTSKCKLQILNINESRDKCRSHMGHLGTGNSPNPRIIPYWTGSSSNIPPSVRTFCDKHGRLPIHSGCSQSDSLHCRLCHHCMDTGFTRLHISSRAREGLTPKSSCHLQIS